MSLEYQPGIYQCLVTDQGFQMTNDGRYPMVVFKVRPELFVRQRWGADGNLAEEGEPVTRNYERTVRVTIVEDNEQALEYALKKLRYAGFTGDSFSDLNLRDRDIRCEVRHETAKKGKYAGQLVEQWDLALPPRKSEPVKHDASIARRLNTIFGRELQKTATAVPPPTTPVGAGGRRQPEDDDIPF